VPAGLVDRCYLVLLTGVEKQRALVVLPVGPLFCDRVMIDGAGLAAHDELGRAGAVQRESALWPPVARIGYAPRIKITDRLEQAGVLPHLHNLAKALVCAKVRSIVGP
jgi:hypothetical protein